MEEQTIKDIKELKKVSFGLPFIIFWGTQTHIYFYYPLWTYKFMIIPAYILLIFLLIIYFIFSKRPFLGQVQKSIYFLQEFDILNLFIIIFTSGKLTIFIYISSLIYVRFYASIPHYEGLSYVREIEHNQMLQLFENANHQRGNFIKKSFLVIFYSKKSKKAIYVN